MERSELTNLLKQVNENVHPVQALIGKVKTPRIILKRISPVKSRSNSLAGWSYWSVMCYAPGNSMLIVDDMFYRVKDLFKNHPVIEITGDETPDYYDDELEAYMRSLDIRIPYTNI